jgi:hypothetical protein
MIKPDGVLGSVGLVLGLAVNSTKQRCRRMQTDACFFRLRQVSRRQ